MKTRIWKATGIMAVVFICLSFIIPHAFNPLESLVKEAMTNWDAKKAEVGTSIASSTSLEVGLRYKYGVLNEYLNIHRLEGVLGLEIFEKGPHNGEINFNSDEFGHYSPPFLSQLEYVMDNSMGTSAFDMVGEPFYKKELQGTARTYYRAYLYLQREDNIIEKYGKNYDGEVFEGYANVEEAEGYDWYESATAPGFWVRRAIDGTDKAFFRMLEKVMRAYDADFLGGETTSVLAHKIGQGMSTWGMLAAGKKQPSHKEDGTVLTSGLRYKYAVLKGILDIKTLEKLTGEPVFKKGPHSDGLNYYSEDEFGHYNVVFLERMKGILYGMLNSKMFNRFARAFYNSELRDMVRSYHRAYKHIQSEGDVIEKYGTVYQQDTFRGYADAEEAKGNDWYDADTAAWFWIRRKVDGTEGYFNQIIETILDNLDEDFEK